MNAMRGLWTHGLTAVAALSVGWVTGFLVATTYLLLTDD